MLVGQAGFDVLDLERLPQVFANLDSFGPRHLDALEILVLLDDLGHFGLDLGEVVLRELVRHIEVIVEAVLDRGAESQLHSLEQPHHGPRHHVRGRVAHDPQGLGILAGQELERGFPLGRQRRDSIDDLAVHFCRQRRLGQPRTNLFGHVDRPDRAGVFTDATVGQFDL